ncbi:hypothetical protein Xentx_00481 [Xenorhabdus thuongxuanensis]|uniref:Uncharacterized protein n=2 Tax=Xenorhabdus thuongxuanensis TaxID=1873484 RepID=A0A1Q5U8J5_9GAMM|nr:hypothetical protein Xentx_00481 [Xenorhabdus thuongxuanensis]
MITCGPYSLDYLVVANEEIEGSLKQGWVKHPHETVEKPKRNEVVNDGENQG